MRTLILGLPHLPSSHLEAPEHSKTPGCRNRDDGYSKVFPKGPNDPIIRYLGLGW